MNEEMIIAVFACVQLVVVRQFLFLPFFQL